MDGCHSTLSKRSNPIDTHLCYLFIKFSSYCVPVILKKKGLMLFIMCVSFYLLFLFKMGDNTEKTGYFEKAPVNQWSFNGYGKYMTKDRRRHPDISTIRSKYRVNLNELTQLETSDTERKRKLNELADDFVS